MLMKSEKYDEHERQSQDSQAEMVRRLLSIENASSRQMRKFNISRVLEMFGRHDLDTGSAEVQVACMTVKIVAMKDHMSRNRKDYSTKRRLEAAIGKRFTMLKYLRRKVISYLTCLEFTCFCADMPADRR